MPNPDGQAGSPWTEAEIEAGIDLYFAMLDRELREEPIVKAEFYRDFCERFPARTRASIERKCQNIAACLVRMGVPLVSGLVPLFNVQTALLTSVAKRVDTRVRTLQDYAQRPAATEQLPSSMHGVLVNAPDPVRDLGVSVAIQIIRRNVDYVAQENANRSLGQAGELWALEYERVLLHNGGRPDLSRRVRHTSADDGDGAGYDIQSFDLRTGSETLIEVKTTRASIWTPFFLTRNEVSVSAAQKERFRLYRLHTFGGTRTRVYTLTGSMKEVCDLQPQVYRALPLARVG